MSKLASKVSAVQDVTFQIRRGETLGLVGESGLRQVHDGPAAIMRLYQAHRGAGHLRRRRTSPRSTATSSSTIAASCSTIFQDPYASLNPAHRPSCEIVAEPLGDRTARCTARSAPSAGYVRKLLEMRRASTREHASRYPHEFSGGQRQRVGIARALGHATRSSSSATSPSRPWTSPSRRRCSTCSRTCSSEFGHHLPVHRARPVRRPAHLRPRGRDVPGQPGRDLGLEEALPHAAPPLHPVAALGRAGARPRHPALPRAHRPAGRPALADQPAERLPLPHALPHCQGDLRKGEARDAPGGRGPLPARATSPRRSPSRTSRSTSRLRRCSSRLVACETACRQDVGAPAGLLIVTPPRFACLGGVFFVGLDVSCLSTRLAAGDPVLCPKCE